MSIGELIVGPLGGDTESRTVFFAQAGSDWREGHLEYDWLGSEWLDYASAIAEAGQPTVDGDSSDYEVIDQFLGGKFAEFVKCVEEGADYKRLDWFSDHITDNWGDGDYDS